MTGKKLAGYAAASAARVAAAWGAALTLTMLVRPGDVSRIRYSLENLRFTGIAALALFAALTAASALTARKLRPGTVDYAALLAAAAALAATASYRFAGIYYAAACWVIVAAAAALCLTGDRLRLPERELGDRASRIVSAALAAGMFVFVALVCLARYAAYYAPTYDFGIFANLFENMRKTGLPVTTCERDALVSHFTVHISPVLYLLLPVYWLVPRPETLLVIQAAAVMSGAVPAWLLARKKTGSALWALVFAAVWVCYPAFVCGTFFDFHENKLLAPLILWTLWAAENDRRVPFWLFLGLTLLVKEDAAVYAAVIGLYVFFGLRRRGRGAAAFALSVAYFVGAVALLSAGEGAQIWRYDNIAEGGFAALIGACLLNPMRVLGECVSAEKIPFLVQMLLPLGGLPLVRKRPAGYLLLIPLALVNLMPDYVYQHDVGYQYGFGSGALLIYSAMGAVEEFWPLLRRTSAVCAAGLCLAAALSFCATGARGDLYFDYYREEAAQRQAIDGALSLIPADAPVAASTLFTAHLAFHDEVYDLDDTTRFPRYLALDLRRMTETEETARLSELDWLGCERLEYVPGVVAVYRTGN